MEISFVIPSRNNLKYFKWAYDSIRKNQGDNHTVYICAASDACTDGTVEYFKELSERDDKFKYIVNKGPERLGLTILYDRIIDQLVDTEIAIIYHADMYLAPGALNSIEDYMYTLVHTDHVEAGFEKCRNLKTIVSLTRIEPPLHPQGPEKIIQNFGIEPEQFQENAFLDFIEQNVPRIAAQQPTTEGVFAPWAFYVQDFNAVHGHDPLFAPQTKEDSDIFNRFLLHGCKFIQTWEGFVYHMTARGSRFNPNLTQVGQNSNEWNQQNMKSTRNFIRKWGHMVKHDQHMKPIVPNKYDIGFILENADLQAISAVEPWTSTLYCTTESQGAWPVQEYIQREQPNTLYDLNKKIKWIPSEEVDKYFNSKKHGVWIKLNAKLLNQDYANFITNIQEILEDSGQIGEMEYNLMNLNINSLEDSKYLLLSKVENTKGETLR